MTTSIRLEAYLSGRDVFTSVLTGAGKSSTLGLAPHAFDCLTRENSCNSKVALVHVVLLTLIMKDQVLNLNSDGISVSYLGDCLEQQLQDINIFSY